MKRRICLASIATGTLAGCTGNENQSDGSIEGTENEESSTEDGSDNSENGPADEENSEEETETSEPTPSANKIIFEEPENLKLSRDHLAGEGWVRDNSIDSGHSHTRILFTREANSRYEFVISEISAYDDIESAKHREKEARRRSEDSEAETTDIDFADSAFKYESDGWAVVYFRDTNVFAGIFAGVGVNEWNPTEPKPDMRDELASKLRESWERE